MTDTPQYGSHPDAEQLSAFAEGVLPAHERLHVLAHMETCARCREIAFLALDPAPVKARELDAEPWWKGWWSRGLSGGLLAGGGALAALALLLGVFLWKRPERGLLQPSTVAQNREQASSPFVVSRAESPPPVPDAKSAAASPAVADKARAAAPPAGAVRLRSRTAPQPMAQAAATPPAPSPASPFAGGAPAMAPPPPVAANAVAPPPASAVRGKVEPFPSTSNYAYLAPMPQRAMPAPQSALSKSAVPPAAPANAAGVMVDSQRIEQLPVNGRSVAALKSANARPAVTGPLRLRIEHSGKDDGKAELMGTVLDPSGATIPGATVTLLGPVSGVSAKTVTDGSGRFALEAVAAGQYQAQIAAPGFLTATQSLDLKSGDLARAETVLNIGAVSEAVEVNADSMAVSTANASLSSAEVAESKRASKNDALPGGHAAVTTIRIGDHAVAVDSAGTVFTRRGDKRWKRVEAQWTGVVKMLETAPADPTATYARKAKGQVFQIFQITTSTGEIWFSIDGDHWVRR